MDETNKINQEEKSFEVNVKNVEYPLGGIQKNEMEINSTSNLYRQADAWKEIDNTLPIPVPIIFDVENAAKEYIIITNTKMQTFLDGAQYGYNIAQVFVNDLKKEIDEMIKEISVLTLKLDVTTIKLKDSYKIK